MVDHEELRARYEKEAPPPPAGLELSNAAVYIHYKAFVYLVCGPDSYRSFDALQQPPAHWPSTTLDAILAGCRQLVQWQGFSIDQPLRDVGIGNFYRLLQMFHFELVSQALVGQEAGRFMDRMQMRHVVDGREVTLYNLVPSPDALKAPGPNALSASLRRPLR